MSWSFQRSGNAPRSCPAEAGERPGRRPILTSDPAVIAKTVEQTKQEGIIDLAAIGLVAVGHAGDLDVAVAAEQRFGMTREIAFADLAMVEIELHRHVGARDAVEERHRLLRCAQEIAGIVVSVERLDE